MILDGVLTQAQRLSDLPVFHALRDLRNDLVLPSAQQHLSFRIDHQGWQPPRNVQFAFNPNCRLNNLCFQRTSILARTSRLAENNATSSREETDRGTALRCMWRFRSGRRSRFGGGSD